MKKNKKYILWFKEVNKEDVGLVGGKNASLGEMVSNLSKKGVSVPNGFATTSFAFWHFMNNKKLTDKIKIIFSDLDVDNIKNLQERGKKVRKLILRNSIPKDLEKEILESYHKLSKEYKEKFTDVAVRTSATAEDLPGASFAGQYSTYLNVRGDRELINAVKKCLSSLFTDRAIFYRVQNNFNQLDVALSVGIQKMVRSDIASSGVMFSLDTESGFKDVILINGSYGLGEMIVQGGVTPDEFYIFKPMLRKGYPAIISKNLGKKEQKFVYNKKGGIKKQEISAKDQIKFCLTDKEILTLSKWADIIEKHYSEKMGKWMPMDMEWAKDGKTNKLFIVQARPETIHSKEESKNYYEECQLKSSKQISPILTGVAVGNKIAVGKVKKIFSVSKLKKFRKGEILVTKMTDPDWVPIMKIASAIITDEGSRSCHAAIVSRELGIPCLVGTKSATEILKDNEVVTVDCSQGLNGKIFQGDVPFVVKKYNLKKIPKLKTKIMINLAVPDIAFKSSFLPQDGVGLAREEFIISEKIRIHPLALYHYKELKSLNSKTQAPNKFNIQNSEIQNIVKQIDDITLGYKDKKQFFIDKLSEGVAVIASAFYPKDVIVRFSDFKTNEYRGLIGGELFEPKESNPMLGWRGASRYYDSKFEPAFGMECKAMKKAREVFGLKNIVMMIPFCRTVEEGKKVIKLMKKYGLEQGKDGLRVYVMCEIPSNVILADKFLEIFDGFSIGSNDLTQLSLGIDRDNANITHISDERDDTIKEMLQRVIYSCKKKKKYCGICGQAPSDYPKFAEFLMEKGIESMSLSPDTVIKTILSLAKKSK
ncbi:MAG: phosphoenolpyruvate synthase [Patescibacteria group bacterium]|nr:phosphoenolpyruvate synthase [Patescibacteria group bacterium]